MSLPREILDQLLSGYLDDALDADERARVERLLETDEEAAAELEELRQIRQSLRSLSEADSDRRLPEDFSDRVLEAAIDAAQNENLGDDHPLIRLAAQQATVRSSEVVSGVPWRAAAALVALAASIMIAVFVWQRDGELPDLPEGPEVAMNDSSGAADQQPRGLPEPVGPEVVVQSAPAESQGVDLSPAEPKQPDGAMSPEGAIANNNSLVPKPNRVENVGPAEIPMIKAVLVLDVRRSEFGRESQALRRAMRMAKIDSASEKEITEEMVNSAKDASLDGGAADATVLFLRAPAKRLDRFINLLVDDREGIQSIAFTIVQDVNILGVANSLREVDPTKVRHAVSWELSSEGGLVDMLARDLEGMEAFAALDKMTAKTGVSSAAAGLSRPKDDASQNEDEDVPSEVFVLLR